jgi:hypothetical protein
VAPTKENVVLNPAPPLMHLSDLDTPGQVAMGLNPAPEKSVADDAVNTAPTPAPATPIPAEPKSATPPRPSGKQVAAATHPSSKDKPVAPKPVAARVDDPTPFVFASNPLEDKSSRPHFIFNN